LQAAAALFFLKPANTMTLKTLNTLKRFKEHLILLRKLMCMNLSFKKSIYFYTLYKNKIILINIILIL
jgi:hypothetical protein